MPHYLASTQQLKAKSLKRIINVTFENLGLSAEVLQSLHKQGYRTPTPIQQQAIPAIMEGVDVLGAAQTGTGKTAGFTVPLLENLLRTPGSKKKRRSVRALILTPTRELAAQVGESVRQYGRNLPFKTMTMFGGVSINPQYMKLRGGVDIITATPGRLLDHANQRTVNLSELEILVLDEADRMLDMGFIHDIRKIMRFLPEPGQRQTLLFSATFSKEIKQLSNQMLHRPRLIEVAPQNRTADKIVQKVHLLEKGRKRALLTHLIKENDWQQVLVFTRTKHGANRLATQLTQDGILSAAIHGNKSQGARTKALAEFKQGNVKVLVATDIAARGLDIDQLPQVVNFELPNVPEDYVHRIGRTARAGRSGEATSLVSGEELDYLQSIEKLVQLRIPRVEIHGFTSENIVRLTPESRESLGKKKRPRRRANPKTVEAKSGVKPKRGGRTPSPKNKKSAGNRNQPGGSSKKRRADKKKAA